MCEKIFLLASPHLPYLNQVEVNSDAEVRYQLAEEGRL